jgi:hypothetical protein
MVLWTSQSLQAGPVSAGIHNAVSSIRESFPEDTSWFTGASFKRLPGIDMLKIQDFDKYHVLSIIFLNGRQKGMVVACLTL